MEAEEEVWCHQYDIVTKGPGVTGYVPRTYHCHDIQGRFSQKPGLVVQEDGSLGDCTFADGETVVSRDLVGEFAYCEDPDNDCRDTFAGGYLSVDYVSQRSVQRRHSCLLSASFIAQLLFLLCRILGTEPGT